MLFGILIALNLQTSFLTPPMAMSCYYLKGVAPPGVELTEIFRGALPFLSMVLVAMVIVYTVPAATTWLPTLIYGAFR
jgi:TRAP-type mannitol/chloroaromatic compound transport system permease large subunit